MTGPDGAISVYSHVDLVTAVVQMHGEDPAGGVYFVPLGGPPDHMVIGTARFDMPDPYGDTAQRAAETITACTGILNVLADPNPEWDPPAGYALILFGPAHTAEPLAEQAKALLGMTFGAVRPFDVIRVQDGRCWSYTCTADPDHRPGGPGEVYDPLSDTAIETATRIWQARL